jgi:hypothetical protein
LGFQFLHYGNYVKLNQYKSLSIDLGDLQKPPHPEIRSGFDSNVHFNSGQHLVLKGCSNNVGGFWVQECGTGGEQNMPPEN